MSDSAVPHNSSVTAAIQLGWRVAELYALADDTGECSSDTLLPAHGSLAPADQLELQLRAAAGDARRAGVTSKEASLEALVECARRAVDTTELRQAFRDQLRCCHVEVSKDLWALEEASGKAYELGNGLSDTYGRICRAYRWPDESPEVAWSEVFATDRIERLKKLLDDLQSRLDGTGVTVVRDQLDQWAREVPRRIDAHGVPELDDVRTGLRRQTIIWRQLVAGDKPCEAFLGDAGVSLRDEMRSIVWRRYRRSRYLLPLAAGLALLVVALPELVDLYQGGMLESGLVSALFAIAGAVGLTKGFVVLTIRGRLQQWSHLLWSHALARKVAEVTSKSLDDLLPAAPPPERHPIRDASTRVGARLRESIATREPAHP
jgi:hypothetical protein